MMFIELRLVVRRQGWKRAIRNRTLPCIMSSDLTMLTIGAHFLGEDALTSGDFGQFSGGLGKDPSPFVPKCLALLLTVTNDLF